jgi:hypothetical protein
VTNAAKRAAKLAALTIGVAALAWLSWRILRDSNTEPYRIDSAGLSGWTVVAAGPRDPALVALQPPPTLAADLFNQVSERTRQPLVAPAPALLPVVLKGEYADSLQGAIGIDHIMRLAQESDLQTVRFEPVCMGHRRDTAPGRSAELFFVLFHAPAFDGLRQELLPPQPEHGGVGVYDPAALRPILPIASTDGDFARWWPMSLAQNTDCKADLLVK